MCSVWGCRTDDGLWCRGPALVCVSPSGCRLLRQSVEPSEGRESRPDPPGATDTDEFFSGDQ